MGYHIAGFDPDGRARLFHVYYAYERPRRPEQKAPAYQFQDQSPTTDKPGPRYLYNGRNEFADVVLWMLFHELDRGGQTRYDPADVIDRVCLADFVARFAGEVPRR